MKKLFICAIALQLLFICFLGYTCLGQTITKLPNGNYVVKSVRDTVKKPTGQTITLADGKVYPVYVSATGKLYYMRVAVKSGNVYKVYIKTESK